MKRRRYIGGIMLAIGIVLFLIAVGAGSLNIAEAFATLWPLILINIGIEILFAKKSAVIRLARTISVFIFIAYALFYPIMSSVHTQPAANLIPAEYKNADPSIMQEQSVFTKKNATPIAATLNIDDYSINAKIKGDQFTDLSNANSYYEDSAVSGDWILYEIGDIKSPNSESPASLSLSKDQNWDINAKVYRYNGEIDAENLTINGIYVESYHADLNLAFNEKAKTVINIDSVKSKLKLHVPRKLGIQITCNALTCNMPHGFELVDGEVQNDAYAENGGIIVNVEALNAEIDIEYTD